MNEKNEWSGELNVEKYESLCEKVSVKAVMDTVNFMKTAKVAGSSGTTSELFKVCLKMRV